jgi:hypothetical protein
MTRVASPAASSCVESTAESALARGGAEFTVSVIQTSVPPAVNDPAVAYAGVARTLPGARYGRGVVIFLGRGNATIQVSGLALGGQFPPELLGSLVRTLDRRLESDEQRLAGEG